MSKTKPSVGSHPRPPLKTAAEYTSAAAKSGKDKPDFDFAFGRINYIYMLVGIGFILLGFILMAGGKSNDPNVFNPEIFSFRRITIAPVLVIIGFIIEVFAIVKKADD